MKTYITFGQIHVHSVNGKTFDKNCIAAIESESEEEGRKMAFEYFGPEWHNSYFGVGPEVVANIMKYFPRGIIEVD